MKTITLLIISTFFLTSCGPDNIEQDTYSLDTKELAGKIVDDLAEKTAKDTGFNGRQENNKFKNDLSNYSIDKKTTKMLEGSWELNGDTQMEFLKTKFKPKAKVVFTDSLTITPTAWGELSYNSSAKFYSTEYSSEIYEYCIAADKKLMLIQFDYYNQDLTFKSKPELITTAYSISFTDKNNIELFNDFQNFKFTRIKKYH
ncbi:MAG: hypothetical protein V4511_05230 [Bacteroidota bacterium]